MTDPATTYVRTAVLPLDELTPFPGNAKRGQVDVILSSLRRNGQYRSLVVREVPGGALVVLAGNHTMQALGAHGAGDCGKTVATLDGPAPCGVCRNDPGWLASARCEVVHCDDDTARRVNLVDNRASELGSYDFEALAELLGEVGGLEGTGYTDRDVEDITALLTAPPDEVHEVSEHGEPNEDIFRPQIKLTVDTELFDRWRNALDAHPGKDDEAKLAGLLGEVETARKAAA